MSLLLSHAPINKAADDKLARKEGQFTQSGGGGEEYVDRAESQKELNNLVDLCFEGKSKLNFEDFKHVSEAVSSEMFLCMFSLIKTHFPSMEQFKRYELALKRKTPESLLRSPTMSRKLASPKILSKFSPLSQIVKFSTPRPKSNVVRLARDPEEEDAKDSKDGAIHLHPLHSKFGPKGGKSSFAPIPEVVDSPIGPVVRLAASKPEAPAGEPTEAALFCECGKVFTDLNKLLCDDCLRKINESKCEGYLSKVGKRGIKRMWVCIEKREIFCTILAKADNSIRDEGVDDAQEHAQSDRLLHQGGPGREDRGPAGLPLHSHAHSHQGKEVLHVKQGRVPELGRLHQEGHRLRQSS